MRICGDKWDEPDALALYELKDGDVCRVVTRDGLEIEASFCRLGRWTRYWVNCSTGEVLDHAEVSEWILLWS